METIIKLHPVLSVLGLLILIILTDIYLSIQEWVPSIFKSIYTRLSSKHRK